MKNPVILSGSIVKKEILEPIEANIIDNTFVAEASNPYANYYGQLPQEISPNSLFLFTKRFYFLEEILRFSEGFEKCLLEKRNIASSYIDFKNKQYPAIRIKNFPDYTQLAKVQECLLSQGVEFSGRLLIKGEVKARINKLFFLSEIEPDIYMDINEDNKGYIIPNKLIPQENFDEIVDKIRNNGNCKLFDAVYGEALRNGKLVEIIRIYAEGINLQLLKYLNESLS